MWTHLKPPQSQLQLHCSPPPSDPTWDSSSTFQPRNHMAQGFSGGLFQAFQPQLGEESLGEPGRNELFGHWSWGLCLCLIRTWTFSQFLMMEEQERSYGLRPWGLGWEVGGLGIWLPCLFPELCVTVGFKIYSSIKWLWMPEPQVVPWTLNAIFTIVVTPVMIQLRAIIKSRPIWFNCNF